MIGELDDIKICGMASAVPTYEDDNSKYETIIGKRQYRRQTRITGVSKRRISGIREVRIYVSERQNHFWKD